MKNMLLLIWITLLTSLMINGCGPHSEKNFLGSGTLEAEEVLVSSVLAGNWTLSWSRKGTSVEAGQILALIEKDKLEVQYRQSLGHPGGINR